MQIIVLGMHRSGTSAVGHMLDALGFEFGPKSLALKPEEYNLKGFWEREDVVELDDYALSQQDALWWKPGKWNPSELSPAFIREFDQRAGEIIASFPPGHPWFLKDPRMCITAPLWEKHFDDPIYLFAYRDPVEVSLSLWSRDQLPQAEGIALWERYTGDALNFTRDKKRLLICYDDLVGDPKAALLALISGIRALGAEPLCDVDAAAGKLDVDRKLRHHKKDSLALQIALTPSQELLNNRFRDGSILSHMEMVDVSGANRQLLDYRAGLEDGELPIREDVSRKLHLEINTNERRLRSQMSSPTADSSDPALQWLMRVDTLLDAHRAGMEACICETVQALEEARLFGRHLEQIRRESDRKRSRFQKFGAVLAGNPQAIEILRGYCSQISRWNPLRGSYRKTKRLFEHLHANPGKVIMELIISPDLSREPIPAALKSAEALLGEIILGRLVFLPETALLTELQPPPTGSDDACARVDRAIPLLEAFQCTLDQTANRVRVVKEETERFAGHLERTFGDKAPLLTRSEVREGEKAIKSLLEWGTQLSAGHPLDASFRKAKAQFSEFKKKTHEHTPVVSQPGDTFRSMIPTVRKAAEALGYPSGRCELTNVELMKLLICKPQTK